MAELDIHTCMKNCNILILLSEWMHLISFIFSWWVWLIYYLDEIVDRIEKQRKEKKNQICSANRAYSNLFRIKDFIVVVVIFTVQIIYILVNNRFKIATPQIKRYSTGYNSHHVYAKICIPVKLIKIKTIHLSHQNK
jgi:hypothetical protein